MAIVNFFSAIADGVIDEKERHMMGLVYYVLRIAMVVILLTVLARFSYEFIATGTIVLTTMTIATLLLVFVLYANSALMTLHYMPSSIGPALQAATWYSLGVMASLDSLKLVTFSTLPFFLGYLSAVLLAIAIVNGMMAHLKSRR